MYCPHCHLQLKDWEPARPANCPHCRLVIGAHRSLERPPEGVPGRAVSASALLALRQEAGTKRAPDEVVVALRCAARSLSRPISELRMVDYAELERQGGALVPLADVLATFGGWKPARFAAMAAARAERLGET